MPPARFLTVTEKGFDRTLKRIRDQQQILKDPDMSWPVRGAARVWDRNFRGEGSMVGGWKPLSPMTQRVRAARGYNPEHPILRQSGTLHRVAIRSLMDARSGKSSTGDGASMRFQTTGKGRALLTVSGAKVQNQFGSQALRLPRRRFWFVNGIVVDEAAKSLQKWYDREIQRLG